MRCLARRTAAPMHPLFKLTYARPTGRPTDQSPLIQSPRIAWLVAGRLILLNILGNHRSWRFFFSSPLPIDKPAFFAACSFSVAYPSRSSTTPLVPDKECLDGDADGLC